MSLVVGKLFYPTISLPSLLLGRPRPVSNKNNRNKQLTLRDYLVKLFVSIFE